MSRRTVLHADLDAFFASVEQRDDPALRGRPVAVGGGVITAASYEARAHGVKAPMGGAQARRLCPDLVVVPGRWEAYTAASRAVFEVLRAEAPVVEAASIDEAYLDVTGLEAHTGTGAEIGARIRRRVREEVGLPLSIGVATTKVLAKVAGGSAKPDGLLVLPPEDELWFLHGLPVERIPGVGPATTALLQGAGVRTVGDAAAAGELRLCDLLGKARGRWLWAVAHNHEPRRVAVRSRRSFGAQSAFRAGRPAEDVDRTAVALADRVTRRMRRKGSRGRTVTLRLRFADFTRATRSCTLPGPTDESRVVLAALRGLLAEAAPLVQARGLTLVGVAVTGLEAAPEGEQLELRLDAPAARTSPVLAGPGGRPLEGHDDRALDAALDAVRDRFGAAAIARGGLLKAGPDLEAWAD